MKASILFYSLPPPNSTAPRTIEYRYPCVPRWSRFLSKSLPQHSRVHSVLCCAYSLICGCISLSKFCFIYFFAPYFNSRNDATASSPIVIALRVVSPNFIPLPAWYSRLELYAWAIITIIAKVNSLPAMVAHERPLFDKLLWRLVTSTIFVRC